jgi:hypothetical protein
MKKKDPFIRREIATITDSDVLLDDHGFVMWNGRFEYNSGSQGTGLILNECFGSFIENLFKVWGNGIELLSEINGLQCWVTHDNGEIFKIEPLRPKDGEVFDIKKWRTTLQKEAKK